MLFACLSTDSLSKSYNSSTNSNSNRKAGSKLDNRLVQKKQKINNTQVRTIKNNLLAIDNLILEGPDYQDYYSSQDPYNKSIKLLATAVVDELLDSRLKKDSNIISLLQNYKNKFQSLYIIPTLAAPAATAA